MSERRILRRWYSTEKERKTYKLIPPMHLTPEHLRNPMSREGIVFWGVHDKFGPWVILPHYLTINHIIRITGRNSLIQNKPVQVENKRTGIKYYIVRRCDLRDTLMKASHMFTMNPSVLLKVLVTLRPAYIPMTFRFDKKLVKRSLNSIHLKNKPLLLKLFEGTQKLDKVMHNISTYSLHRPGEAGLFMQWVGYLLHNSIIDPEY